MERMEHPPEEKEAVKRIRAEWTRISEWTSPAGNHYALYEDMPYRVVIHEDDDDLVTIHMFIGTGWLVIINPIDIMSFVRNMTMMVGS